MSRFDDDTRTHGAGDHAWSARVSSRWNIGATPNGGYLLALAASGMRRASAHQDPLSITAHYLKPGVADAPCRIEARVVRAGRALSTVHATLAQADGPRLEVVAAMGDLRADDEAMLAVPRPVLPPPEACPQRSPEAQGVSLPILGSLDIRLNPDELRADAPRAARVSGWIRFRDGREPDPLACLLFADAFPPAVFGLLGMVGWVPTVELTVNVRRRPAPGWMCGQFRTVDVSDGRLIEDGMLWDAEGRLIAQSRQLALLRMPPGAPGGGERRGSR